MKQYLSTWESPLNNSLSKQKFSFAKAPRITHESKNICAQSSYDLPDTLNKRMAGIGYGQKYDLVKQGAFAPAPTSYKLQCFTDENQVLQKGVSIALGRDDMKIHGIFGSLNNFSPGPDRYQLPPSIKDRKYTFGLRTQLKSKSINPGPGQYEAPNAINEKGEYFLSKFRNSGAAIIGKDKDRFKTIAMDAPEPGRYSLANLGITPEGVYPKNGYRSTVKSTIPKADRKGFFEGNKNPTPGPGQYKAYSQFN